MKTAITELIKKIESFGFILHDDTKKEFLEKEKEHLIMFHIKGQQWSKPSYNLEQAEQYYKEIYETKKSN